MSDLLSIFHPQLFLFRPHMCRGGSLTACIFLSLVTHDVRFCRRESHFSVFSLLDTSRFMPRLWLLAAVTTLLRPCIVQPYVPHVLGCRRQPPYTHTHTPRAVKAGPGIGYSTRFAPRLVLPTCIVCTLRALCLLSFMHYVHLLQ